MAIITVENFVLSFVTVRRVKMLTFRGWKEDEVMAVAVQVRQGRSGEQDGRSVVSTLGRWKLWDDNERTQIVEGI